MKTFEVLDRKQNLDQNYLLEASAGTGKTFSIENIVVRLLIERDPIQIEEILVVTFTRAATRDLKTRIRANIEKALHYFRSYPVENPSEDYLKAIIEQGEEAIQFGKRKLEQALLAYDQAQIYTIHGFCSRILSDLVFEGDVGLEISSEENPLPRTYILRVVRDFFRTGLVSEKYSQAQLESVLKMHDNSIEKLERALLDMSMQSIEVAEAPSLKELVPLFSSRMGALKSSHRFTSKHVLEDFLKLAPCYEKLCGRDRKPKPEIIEKVSRFAALFDLSEWGVEQLNFLIGDGLFLVQALHLSRRNKKNLPPDKELHIPNMSSLLKENLVECVSPEITFSRMVKDCKNLLKRHLKEEEKLGFDELLQATHEALKNETFQKAVREKFRAAIIDEFQDTDPVQWGIFNTLFLRDNEGWGNLYLVGDPKQSIYAFRQADIYTYLKAGEALGEKSRASLDTNYRSQPELIDSLNEIFSEENAPGFISLPLINGSLPYVKVHSSPLVGSKRFSDELGSLHFFIAEDEKARKLPLEMFESEYYFPFMAQEIQRLNRMDEISLKEMAILVSDRYQAQRMSEYLKRWNIPSMTQRSSSLAESEALSALKDVIKGVLNPSNESAFKTALGGRIIGFTDAELMELSDHATLQDLLSKFYSLRMKMIQEGFSTFFQELMKISFKGVSVTESIFLQQSGESFFQDLQQIVDAVLDFERKNHASPEAILRFLNDFPVLLFNDDERIKKGSDPTLDAVNIITLHTSKGLEYAVVFALGLIKRTKPPSQIVPISTKEGRLLTPVPDVEDERYLKQCDEIDAEKMRQLYVGMTRAKWRLYAPVAFVPNSKSLGVGEASPMELFLARLGQPSIDMTGLYDRIKGCDGNAFYRFIEKAENKITITRLSQSTFHIEKWSEASSVTLTPPLEFEPKYDPAYLVSFTTLSKDLSHHSGSEGAPHNYEEENKSPLTLPSGSDTGNLLHAILEDIPIELIKTISTPSELTSFIAPYVKSTRFERWVDVVSEIVFNAFKKKISPEFCLADLNPDEVFRETEFLYPYESNFLKGIIDMMFRINGKYYILDWKSNWLGSEYTDYSEPMMREAMESNHYFLQAKLYQDALKKYLRIFDEGEFDSLFGGVFYLFLRGISLDNEQLTGVYRVDR